MKKDKRISARLVLGLIDLRRKAAQRDFQEAMERKQWSRLPGFDGIDIGLMMAEKIILETLEQMK